MRSSYKRLGDYIVKVNNRNKDLITTNLLGINIDKYFMPSVANVVGTDLSKYKLVSKGQFACNRMHVGRDVRLPVALSTDDDEFIVSPAYDVFEVKNTKELLPKYLMMWFSRSEFDRESTFYTDADVRLGLPWDAFIDMKLPIPDIDIQREIVRDYETITQRVENNKNIIKKLESTAGAIYREWFVDFEFPNDTGKPYKSSGGEMEYNKELDMEVPVGWGVNKIKDVINFVGGAEPGADNYSDTKENDDYVGFYRVGDISEYGQKTNIFVDKKFMKNRFFDDKDVLISLDGTIGKIFFGTTGAYSSGIRKTKPIKDYIGKMFILCFLRSKYFDDVINTGSGSETTIRHAGKMLDYMYLAHNKEVFEKFNDLTKDIFDYMCIIVKENIALEKMKSLLLSRMVEREEDLVGFGSLEINGF